ncbi:MAG TPA: hypothetical protein VF676_10680 [Flavobacterium sp.]|jgi:hypothetical protein
MKNVTLLFLMLIAASCGVKQAEKNLAAGNYDSTIATAVNGLRNNKDKKGKQDYVLLLEDAYAKAKERDLREIALLAKDANPRNLEQIFETYRQLNERQEQIRPLLPLKVLSENREARFVFEDYSEQIINSKNALSSYLYTNTKALLMTTDKKSIRRAYDDLLYLEQINPNYKEVRQLIEQARVKGSEYVNLYTKNETNMIIPIRLENDLLDFSTYGLNDKWTVYHSNKVKGIDYDYGIILNFRQINITPEKVEQNQFTREREVNFGKKKKVDRRGNVVRDSLGNIVMVDDIRMVRATVYETRQFKAAQVTAKVDYIDFRNNQLLQSFPLSSEFVFENRYARIKGDKRAVEEPYLDYLMRSAVPFPSNEQMVFDTGEDLKAKLKEIITRNRINR